MLHTELFPQPSKRSFSITKREVFCNYLYISFENLYEIESGCYKMCLHMISFTLCHQINLTGIICWHRKGYNTQTPKKINAQIWHLVIFYYLEHLYLLKTSYGPGYSRILITLISFDSLTTLKYIFFPFIDILKNAFPHGTMLLHVMQITRHSYLKNSIYLSQ